MKNPTALRFFLFFFFIAFVLLFSQTTNVYAQTTNCSLNIYPQPTPGTHHYTVTLTNNTSTPGYSFITNYWVDGQPSGNPSNVSTSSDWYVHAPRIATTYQVTGTAGIPIANSSITYETDLTFSSSFEGVDIALLSQSNSSFDICSQGHGTYAITYTDLSVTPTPTPTPANPPPPTSSSCSLNIYPQPIPGTHHYTVTLTNSTATPGYKFITNYWVDGQPSGNPSNVSTSSDWYVHAPRIATTYQVTGTAGIPIANSSITYETDLTFSSSFEGVDIALLSQSNSSFDICSQDHESYSVTYNNPTTILSVPYFSQNSLPWGPTEYDNSSGKISNPTMDRWGCAVTSAAMVLNYHNIKKMPDGTDLDPGSLNVWLKNNKGYLTGYNNIDGFYSYFNWPVIGKLTKQLFDAGRANVKLMHKRAYPSNNTTIILNEDLKKFPDILGVNNSQTLSHFVVAKGKSNNTYSINDPEWNYPTLNSFNNSYTQVDRYIPSSTNLSYLVAVVNPSVELLITNPQNSKTGKHFYNNQIQEFNEINNASYSYQAPIGNPNDQNTLEELGTGVNEFLLPEPENGKYEIKLSSNNSGFYEINITSFENDGDDTLNKITGIISSNNDETIEVDYSQENSNNSGSKKIVTFQTLIDDIKESQSLNLINKGLSSSLIALLRNAEKNYQRGMKNIVFIELNIFEKLINQTRGKFNGKILDENAYQILLYDVEYLKNHL